MSLLNKVAIVTGASSGIGAAIALKFATEGAKVAIVDRNEKDITKIKEKCVQNGNMPLSIIADVTNENDAKKIVKESIDKFGKLDILVNNAGICLAAKVVAPNALQVFDKVMDVNLRAMVNITNLAAPYLINSKGNIVNISSNSALSPYVTTGFAYNTSKAAVNHFTRSIALELAPKGVRANVVNPGPVKTNIMKNMGLNEAEEAKYYEIMRKASALGRICEPEEVADLVLFLASDKGRSITGASYIIENGTLLKVH